MNGKVCFFSMRVALHLLHLPPCGDQRGDDYAVISHQFFFRRIKYFMCDRVEIHHSSVLRNTRHIYTIYLKDN